MYAYFNGMVADTGADYIVMDVGGVGYLVYVPARMIQSLTVGRQAKVYTYLHVREDALILYGFASLEEKEMFLRLQTVSGIGPKMAMGVLSAMTVADVAIALVSEDVTALTRVPGLGRKTAQRLILELREKVDNSELTAGVVSSGGAPAEIGTAATEAVHALVALGLPALDAQKAVRSMDTANMKVEEIIRNVLRSMDNGR